MNYQFPITATNRGGGTRVFNDAETFRAFAFNRANGGVGAYWMEARAFTFGPNAGKLIRIHEERVIQERWYRDGVKNEWIARDDRGRPVDTRDFQVPYVHRGYRWTLERQRAAEAGLPIPGTGKRRRRRCHCREVCGGNHRDARWGDETAALNAAQNDYEGL